MGDDKIFVAEEIVSEPSENFEAKRIEILVRQILKQNPDEKRKLDDYFKDMPGLNKNDDDWLKFDADLLKESEYSQFLGDDTSYKLTVNDGKNIFEGYYEKAMDELKKVKDNSYTALGRQIESENLRNALVIIKDKKERNIDSFLFDSAKKAAVDAYKWSSIVWWQMLYELQGKVVF